MERGAEASNKREGGPRATSEHRCSPDRSALDVCGETRELRVASAAATPVSVPSAERLPQLKHPLLFHSYCRFIHFQSLQVADLLPAFHSPPDPFWLATPHPEAKPCPCSLLAGGCSEPRSSSGQEGNCFHLGRYGLHLLPPSPRTGLRAALGPAALFVPQNSHTPARCVNGLESSVSSSVPRSALSP